MIKLLKKPKLKNTSQNDIKMCTTIPAFGHEPIRTEIIGLTLTGLQNIQVVNILTTLTEQPFISFKNIATTFLNNK